MSNSNKPSSEKEVFIVMQEYSQKKGYLFSDTQLKFMAENCFLYFESRGWASIKYWPAVAMKWILNEKGKFNKQTTIYKKPSNGKSVRDKIMEQENE